VLLTQPAEGTPEVVETFEALREASDALAAGRGPIAVDTERASGYRYSQRAYLVQVRREGAGTFLVDPVAGAELRRDQLRAFAHRHRAQRDPLGTELLPQ